MKIRLIVSFVNIWMTCLISRELEDIRLNSIRQVYNPNNQAYNVHRYVSRARRPVLLGPTDFKIAVTKGLLSHLTVRGQDPSCTASHEAVP